MTQKVPKCFKLYECCYDFITHLNSIKRATFMGQEGNMSKGQNLNESSSINTKQAWNFELYHMSSSSALQIESRHAMRGAACEVGNWQYATPWI